MSPQLRSAAASSAATAGTAGAKEAVSISVRSSAMQVPKDPAWPSAAADHSALLADGEREQGPTRGQAQIYMAIVR